MLDMAVLAEEIAAIVADEVERATAPLIAENSALRDRVVALESVDLLALAVPRLSTLLDERVAALPTAKDGRDGADVDMAEVERMINAAIEARPAPKDGADVDMNAVAAMIADEVSKSVAAIPAPKDGRDGTDVNMAEIERLIDAAVEARPTPKDGADADMDAVAALIADEVAKSVAAIPAPKDGRDGTDGEDGAGIADLVIDRVGNLVATFTDGRMKELGIIVGRDGTDGIPFGVEDLNMTLMEDGRTIRMAFAKGESQYAFEIPVPAMIYRGVWRDGQAYTEGDVCTWGGSLWHCDKAAGGKPDGGDWTLCVKKGRDGKDAR
jgi:integrin beta 3